VLKDGVEVASTYHRHVVVPGAALGGEDTRVSQVGAVIHTAAVIQAYRASLPTD
jgi:hypothetical protein